MYSRLAGGWLVSLLLAACGRVGFDPSTAGSTGPGPFPDAALMTGGTTQTLVIGDTADDGELDTGGAVWSPDGEYMTPRIYTGAWYSSWTWVYLRFALTTDIPATATITSAALAVYGGSPQGWTAGKHLVMFVESSPDPGAVTGLADAPGASHPLTAASVDWPLAGDLTWTVGDWNTTADLAPLVQSLVTQDGARAAGTHLQLWMHANDTSSNSEVCFEDYSNTGGHHAALQIAWTTP